MFFFFATYYLFQKAAGHLGWAGGVHPLHPSPRSAPVKLSVRGHFVMLIEVDMHLISCDPEHFRKKDKEMIDEDQF